MLSKQEQHGSKMAFLDGAPPERLCQPIVDLVQARGGEVKLNSRVKNIALSEDGSVECLELANGESVEGDLYISAMPGVWCKDCRELDAYKSRPIGFR